MLSLLLRRLVWIPPTLFVVSIVTFLVLSLVPAPRAPGTSRDADLAHERRTELPRFFNPAPEDAGALAARHARIVAEGGEGADASAAELARLGGAALPHVVPGLDAFDPVRRRRVALALAPVAARMGLRDAQEARDPARAVSYWNRFWDDRGVEFRIATVRTSVERLARYRTDSRAAELAQLDTYALPAIMERLPTPVDPDSVAVARTLLEAAAHATGRDDRIAPDADVAQAREVVRRWRSFWLAFESDYTTREGAGRVAAMVRETRYGKWAARAALGAVGETPDAQATAERVARAAPVTLALLFGGIALAHALGILLGTIAAAARGSGPDYTVAVLVLSLYTLPTAALATWTRGLATSGLWVPTLVVAAGLLAAPTRHQRASLAVLLSRDVVRAARARGATRARAIGSHALRPAIGSVVTLLAVEPPMALSAVFVVEQAFSLDGLGALTLAAVAERDVGYLMAFSMGAAALAVLVVLATDLAYGALDPRQRRHVLGGA